MAAELDYEAVGAGDALVARAATETYTQSNINRFRKIARGAPAVSVTLAALAGLSLVVVSNTGALQSRLENPISEFAWQGVPPCGLMERGVEYVLQGGKIVGEYQNIEYDTQCRHKCFLVAECQVWTWSPDKSCQLKGVGQDEQPQKRPKDGATSGGMPCDMDTMLFSGTLYCWALMQPNSYEQVMLAQQYQKKINIFACEEYTVISNQNIEVTPGLFTEVVSVDLHCETGGEFGTALNLPMFTKVWRHIVQKGAYAGHEWTVKTDADAVFFADRLKAILPHHPEEGKGVYLNNCMHGMHGPVEVFSRNAVAALDSSWQACEEHFTNGVCGGDCKWGEDMYIDQCLQKVAGVRRDNEWLLLVEDHCDINNAGWGVHRCDGNHVAFHPFKDPDTYNQCMANALGSASVMEQQKNLDEQGR